MAGKRVQRPTSTEGRLRILSARGWLHPLPDAFCRMVAEAGEERCYAAGESICEAGDEGGGIFGMLEGAVGCWIASQYSELLLAHVVHPGDWFGEGPAVTGQARTMSFRAMEPSSLLYLGQAAIRRMGERDPDTGRYLAVQSENAARTAIRALCDLLMPDMEQKLAAVLLRVTGVERGIAVAPDGFRLSQTELGEMCGISRNHANRILQKLQARGLIRLGYQRVIIADAARLAQFAGGGLDGRGVIAA